MAFDSMGLRQAEEADVPVLVRLLQRSWIVTWAPELPFEAVQVFAASDPARAYAESAWRDFVVAVGDDGVVGMVHAVGDEVAALHVDPGCWTGGVGSALLGAAERQIALSHAVARLEVRAFNTRAHAFYLRRGWSEARRFPAEEYGSPVESIEMRKSV